MRPETQIISAAEAVAEIPSGATVAIGGFVGAGHPEALTAALEQRFLTENQPTQLTLFYTAGSGDREARGLNHLAHVGLLKRVVGGHWNLAPRLGKLALENQIEAYNLPQGILCALLREIAAKRPGVFSQAGLRTFIDPREGGGRLNKSTTEELVELMQFDGEDWLRYRTFPITVGLIRATSADRRGNLSMEREGLIGEVLPIAQAAKNHGGIVIAQVERIVDRIDDPKSVRVPGMLVDYVVEATPEQHAQTFGEQFNESFISGPNGDFARTPLPFSERAIIGRRALKEIKPGSIVNLGIGLPESVAAAAAEAGRVGEFTCTLESGPIGGLPASGANFSCSQHPEAIIDQPAQFDFYDGGGLDVAVLGAAEVDDQGSVNVSSFGGRFAGVGGFVNIAQHAKRVIFCCSFRSGGLEVAMQRGGLKIVREGQHAKFVKNCKQVCFHGPSAIWRGQQVLYVTERAVFELTKQGLSLKEIAPGMLPMRDILMQMEFEPMIAAPWTMSDDCFAGS